MVVFYRARDRVYRGSRRVNCLAILLESRTIIGQFPYPKSCTRLGDWACNSARAQSRFNLGHRACELIYFSAYRSQILVIEQAIETAALMLGSHKRARYCLDMICADFWPARTWTAGIRRFCCNPFRGMTNSCLRPNVRRSCPTRAGRLHEPSSRQAPANKTPVGQLQSAAPIDSAAGWLAVPVLRQHPAAGGAPSQVSQSVGG